MRAFLALRRALSYDGRALRRIALTGLCLASSLVALVGCRLAKKSDPNAGDASVTTNAATASAALAADASAPSPKEAKPACAAPDPEKIAKFDCSQSKVVKTPVPEIADPKNVMAAFYDKVIAAARGTSKERLRIGIYGDSNLTS